MDVQLPFDRERLRQRNRADEADERSAGSLRGPAEGLLDALELSAVVSALAQATCGAEVAADDLAEKARLYVRPLRAVMRS